MSRLPIIHSAQAIELGQYSLEEVHLEFSNGERRLYERLHSHRSPGAVIIAAIPDPDTVLLIREYAVGTHCYELGLPKGRMDAGESILEAANRELKEEVGMGARTLTYLRSLTLAPTYMSNAIHLVLAEDLYPERLPGDEPEELEVIPWKMDRLHELMLRDDCSEARSLAALFIVREAIKQRASQSEPLVAIAKG
ncbi:ADP compounds hydrolase NudE [Thermomonas sp.]|uniref:ADP compounds hydrolase NudE n=1 Tax=Thermomonas sp. TaxID=1971895 RepID=UPI002580E034|nr:ADP compounds hydrolase NudE [Thermomonas sp.]